MNDFGQSGISIGSILAYIAPAYWPLLGCIIFYIWYRSDRWMREPRLAEYLAQLKRGSPSEVKSPLQAKLLGLRDDASKLDLRLSRLESAMRRLISKHPNDIDGVFSIVAHFFFLSYGIGALIQFILFPGPAEMPTSYVFSIKAVGLVLLAFALARALTHDTRVLQATQIHSPSTVLYAFRGLKAMTYVALIYMLSVVAPFTIWKDASNRETPLLGSAILLTMLAAILLKATLVRVRLDQYRFSWAIAIYCSWALFSLVSFAFGFFAISLGLSKGDGERGLLIAGIALGICIATSLALAFGVERVFDRFTAWEPGGPRTSVLRKTVLIYCLWGIALGYGHNTFVDVITDIEASSGSVADRYGVWAMLALVIGVHLVVLSLTAWIVGRLWQEHWNNSETPISAKVGLLIFPGVMLDVVAASYLDTPSFLPMLGLTLATVIMVGLVSRRLKSRRWIPTDTQRLRETTAFFLLTTVVVLAVAIGAQALAATGRFNVVSGGKYSGHPNGVLAIIMLAATLLCAVAVHIGVSAYRRMLTSANLQRSRWTTLALVSYCAGGGIGVFIVATATLSLVAFYTLQWASDGGASYLVLCERAYTPFLASTITVVPLATGALLGLLMLTLYFAVRSSLFKREDETVYVGIDNALKGRPIDGAIAAEVVRFVYLDPIAHGVLVAAVAYSTVLVMSNYLPEALRWLAGGMCLAT